MSQFPPQPPYGQQPSGNPPQYPYSPQQPFGNVPPQPPTFYPPPQPGYPQPGQMQPPPFTPPPSKRTRIARWARRHPIWTVIIIIIGLSVVIGPFTGNHSNDTSTTGGAAPTVAPTHEVATAIPKPTPTPKLQPTQTPVQRIQSQTMQLAKNSTEFGKDLTSKDSNGAVTITETIGEALDNNGAKTEIKTDCFNIQKAIWQKKVSGVTGITVKILGPLQDQYGKQSIDLIGTCLLSDTTAGQFQWDNLDWASAWDNGDYDVVYLL